MRGLVRWRLALQALVAFVTFGVLKYAVCSAGLEFLGAPNTLFSSVIGGAIFVFGLILAGTLSDYKESERIPSEVATLVGSIAEDGRYCKEQFAGFDDVVLRARLVALLAAIRADLGTPGSRSALAALSDITPSLLEMERIGLPANHVVRLKGEQAGIRRLLMRVYYIQRIDFLPSAHNFVRSLVALILALLLFSTIDPPLLSVAIVAFIAYLFVYILRLLKTLDTPFRVHERTHDDVSLFLIEEMEEALAE